MPRISLKRIEMYFTKDAIEDSVARLQNDLAQYPPMHVDDRRHATRELEQARNILKKLHAAEGGPKC